MSASMRIVAIVLVELFACIGADVCVCVCVSLQLEVEEVHINEDFFFTCKYHFN